MTGRNDVHEDDFPDLVKQMHEERDRQFELEYRVSYVVMFNVSMVIFLSLCIQSLDGLSGASCEVAYLSCNLSHNRFRNIYPCKSLKIVTVWSSVIII